MAEWSNAADSKSVVLLWGTEGSNPSLSAIYVLIIGLLQLVKKKERASDVAGSFFC